jgi:hypothetical protein
MDGDLATYIERIELMAFFVGYPFIYLLVNFLSGKQRVDSTGFLKTLQKSLPFSYALVGTLYLALTIRNLFPDFSYHHISAQFQNPFLRFWGISSILFLLPFLRKKNYYSLIHSLVFFLLLIKDLTLYDRSSGDNDIIRNDMKIYTDSLILNMVSLLTVTIIFFLYKYIRRRNNTSPGS